MMYGGYCNLDVLAPLKRRLHGQLAQWRWACPGSLPARVAECDPAGAPSRRCRRPRSWPGPLEVAVRVRLGRGELAFASAAIAAEALLEMGACLTKRSECHCNSKESVKCGDAEPTCAVCLGGIDGCRSVWQLPCGHRFHAKCMYQWYIRRHSCPLCRRELADEVIHHQAAYSDSSISTGDASISYIRTEWRTRLCLPCF